MGLKRIQPWFYREFQCIASHCTDSCCIGWEIDVDPESLERYTAVTGAFGDQLRSGIVRDAQGAHFALDEHERCPFLNKSNLCEIYIHLGADSLCGICREHPRFYEWFGDRVEAGLGLCCEEACRLLLSDEAPLRFEEVKTAEEEEAFSGDEELLEALEPVREKVYALLQDRSQPFAQRLECLIPCLTDVQDEWDGFAPMEETEPARAPDKQQILRLCRAMEPIDDGWTQLVARMEAENAPMEAPDWMYEHAAVYLTYRWLLKAAYDGDVLGKGRLIAAYLHILRQMLQSGAVSSSEEGLRLLSKELEYSQENIDLVQAWDWED